MRYFHSHLSSGVKVFLTETRFNVRSEVALLQYSLFGRSCH